MAYVTKVFAELSKVEPALKEHIAEKMQLVGEIREKL